MPVHVLAYVYLILALSDLGCIVMALLLKDYEGLSVFVVIAPLLLIGFSCNYQICPLQFCLGYLP